MCNFPNIQYNPDFARLRNQKIPLGTYTYLKNNRIVDDHLLDGIPDMEKLEECINEKIKSYNGNDDESLYDIFCLIQIWGGFRGITAFRCNKPFREKWENSIKKQYRLFVETCINVTADKDAPLNICKKDIDIVFNAIQSTKVLGLKVSFITKHSRFWLQRNNEKNPLPIFDNIIANGLFNCKADSALLKQYWNHMIYKVVSLNGGMTLLALERQLFNYYRDKKSDNTKSVKGESKIEPSFRQHKISLPYKNRNDKLIKCERVTLNEERFLLFVAERSGQYHFCQLCYELEDDPIKSKDFNINLLSEVQNITHSYTKKIWYPRRPNAGKTYKYVKFEGDNAESEAVAMYNDILSFIKQNAN